MPPVRPRATADEPRLETTSAATNFKERANTGAGVSKSKKTQINSGNESGSALRAALAMDNMVNSKTSTNGTSLTMTGAPQTEWNLIAVPTLQTYRAAYKIQTPSSYTQPHADILYNSTEIGRRAPSQILARKMLRDLKSYRRKMLQTNGAANGVHKTVLKSRHKDKDETSSQASSNSKRKPKNISNHNEAIIAQSVEVSSPTVVSQTSGSNSDHPPSTLLDPLDPESTIIGRQTVGSLATTIRKHFNAQQLSEAETIARFAYIARQQGFGSGAATKSIGSTNPATVIGHHFTPTQKVTVPIQVEGSGGDGDGWIMGTMGRQVRMSETAGGGAFRLRFRP